MNYKYSFLSKSGIALYNNCLKSENGGCPFAFKMKYILDIPPSQSKSSNKGSALHELFDKFFDMVKIDDGELYFPFVVDDNLKKDFNIFLSYETDRFEYLKSIERLDVYQPVVRERMFNNNRLGIHGIVDRIDKTSEDKYILYDYKSGVYEHQNKWGLRNELAFYHLCVGSEYDLIEWRGLLTAKGYMYKTIPNEKVLDKVSELVDDTWSNIKMGKFEMTKNKMSCSYCGWKYKCPRWSIQIS
tara:strand:- start:20 stop:748 length:729 start_codon:yes stop_codon:yes gene_type:complete